MNDKTLEKIVNKNEFKMFTRHLFNRMNIKDFSIGMGSALGAILLLPYLIPTNVRSCKQATGNKSVSNITIGGFMCGVYSGVLLTGHEIIYYLENINKGNLEILTVPLITNLASSLYELFRHYKNK
ncbi:MAG: hypothetical protein ABIH65_00880 [Nanoarchaeota archaeon]